MSVGWEPSAHITVMWRVCRQKGMPTGRQPREELKQQLESGGIWRQNHIFLRNFHLFIFLEAFLIR